jgi:hypothetical protein
MPMLPATRPNLPSAVASEDKDKRRSVIPKDVCLWLLGPRFYRLLQVKTLSPQSTKRPAVKNRQPSHSAQGLT